MTNIEVVQRLKSATNRLNVEGTYNFRAVEPYRAGAFHVRPATLYRSDSLGGLTESGRAVIEELGIRRVIDLRSASELAASPTVLPSVTITHSPIFESTQLHSGSEFPSLAHAYTSMIDEHGVAIARSVAEIGRSHQGAVLVHCTAGKDRTGVVVAMALLSSGVGRDDVIADYAASEANLSGAWKSLMQANIAAAGFPSLPEDFLVASPPELLAKIIDRVDSTWGSAHGFLQAHGLTDDEHAALNRFVVTDN